MLMEQARRHEVGFKVQRAHRWLLAYQVIWFSQEDIRRQVPMLLVTKRACDHERLKRKLLHTGRHIPVASFALNDELLSFLNSKAHHVSHKHTRAVPHPCEQFRPYLA